MWLEEEEKLRQEGRPPVLVMGSKVDANPLLFCSVCPVSHVCHVCLFVLSVCLSCLSCHVMFMSVCHVCSSRDLSIDI